MDATEWIEAFAEQLGIDPPSEQEFATILELAGVAAHSSERVAAPVACWLSAKAGTPLAEALEVSRRVAPGGQD